MVKHFEASMMGEMKSFLGLQVNQFLNGIFINQSKYILDILKKFGMENYDTVPTPMVEQAKLKLDLVEKPVNHTDYRSIIGSLMYVTSSRPDIMFATIILAYVDGVTRIISLERKINPRNPQHAFKKCEACGGPNHTTTNHYDIEWFKNGEAHKAKKAEALKSTRAESSNANRSKTPTKGPKVVFRDDSTCITKGYGSIKCNGIVFTKKRGIISNSNKEIVMIAPRVRDVYVLDMTSSARESCFFAKASKNLNWLWHKRLAHLNFKTINKLAKQNLIVGLPLLVYSKDKPCSSCDKGKHHRASFKTKQTPSIKKCLHLLHMDLFRPVTPRSINHEKYTLVIVDEYSRVFNTRRQQIEETYHITFDESPEAIKFSKPSVDNINITKSKRYPPNEYLHPYKPSQRGHFSKTYYNPKSTLNCYINGVTRAMANQLSAALAYECLFVDFLSKEEPKKVSEALKHPGWVDAMQDELNLFARNKVWTLVPAPYGKTIIGSRWVYRNKRDETRIVIKNKARLVAQGYNQQEGIDYDETFSLVTRLEAIIIFLAFATYMNFIAYQIDVKSAFLNGKLKEVYVKQPPDFESNEFPNHVCKLDKALYGLKQAPRAWYKTLSTFLTEHKFARGKIDNTLFLYKTQTDENPKESHFIIVKRIFKYLKGTPSLGLWYPKCLAFDLKGYSDSDYVGCNMDRKSTSVEAEYVAAAGCCANILCMKSQLTDYDIVYEKVLIFCDNTSAIEISNNLVLHSRTKHIDIRYHFIRDPILKGDIELHFIPT
uniref:Retrovirus-related Pol polyprotein from transposon TNT 1-94 n=1 Tax=Tanacetum cinerariifolium TaxID=118510 RepID=A0A6L2M571_TANCI|nr:retrovirus-related Pol polyprotein from transposon TNT 1-94 [Tanacetum cinerariifolium]